MNEFPNNWRKLMNILQGLHAYDEFVYEYCNKRGVSTITPVNTSNIPEDTLPSRIMDIKPYSFAWNRTRNGHEYWCEIKDKVEKLEQ